MFIWDNDEQHTLINNALSVTNVVGLLFFFSYYQLMAHKPTILLGRNKS